MARIARGIDADRLLAEPSFVANVTTNSPLRIDAPMGDGLMIMAEANQPVSISAFTMAGAMAPITLAGALAQQNAEILAAVVLSQLVRPGAPLIYGAFTTNVHMRSGAIAFGNPEFAQATMASGQLARRYAMPYKVAVTTGSKAVDAQAGYETQFTLWAAVAAGGHIVAHAAGFLESGLTTSYEKLVVDAEMLQMFAAMMKPIQFDEQSFALQTIAEVGPGGHFFDTPHTMERYETAFYEPLLSDWDNFENWVDRGSMEADRRANGIWKRLLAEYHEPALDPAIAEELDAYVARRRSEIEAADAA
jgi:trimethylamine--corrinoid protein Co-methyltransferase